MKSPLTKLPENWEANKLPEIQNLHFKASKLKAAIFSQEYFALNEIGLNVHFTDWYKHLNEQLSELLNGSTIDVKEGDYRASRLLLDMINDLPGNWSQYQIFKSQLISIIDSDLH
ncbi:hypothetical protein [Hymenobacter sp. AT01-02]|uniref:hypothetical protein n=1 Tax=Hymenobacter sp. AT01-02 TaxID=1571877 RepID=UPI0006E222FE|nr:hypothetical protein [Hymenobacter sp. AT01-02]